MTHGNLCCPCTASDIILSGTDFSGMLLKNQVPIKSMCLSCLLWRVLHLGSKQLGILLSSPAWPHAHCKSFLSSYDTRLLDRKCYPGAKRGRGTVGSVPVSTRHVLLPRDPQGHSGYPPTSRKCVTSSAAKVGTVLLETSDYFYRV